MIDHHGFAETAEESAGRVGSIVCRRVARLSGPDAGSAGFLEALDRAGIPKAIATSSRRWFATAVLGYFDLEPQFRFVLTAEDVVQAKPHPEIYRTAAARLGSRPAAYVGLGGQ
jgi:HAD superfamily hydrolase (TIGR01509 family)